jgi:hypothetical protein
MTEPLPYLTRVARGLEKPPVAGMLDLDAFADYVAEVLVPDLKASGREATAADFETCLHFIAGLVNDEVRRGGYPGPEAQESRMVWQPGDLIQVKPAPEKS